MYFKIPQFYKCNSLKIHMFGRLWKLIVLEVGICFIKFFSLSEKKSFFFLQLRIWFLKNSTFGKDA